MLKMMAGSGTRAAPNPDFIDTSITKYCYNMYLQVQVPIPIHEKI